MSPYGGSGTVGSRTPRGSAALGPICAFCMLLVFLQHRLQFLLPEAEKALLVRADRNDHDVVEAGVQDLLDSSSVAFHVRPAGDAILAERGPLMATRIGGGCPGRS